jgi:hypothetical protein
VRGHCYSREADKSRDADGDGADHREDRLPGRGSHGELSDTIRGVVAGDGGRRDEKQDDQQPELCPAREADRELADASSLPRDPVQLQIEEKHNIPGV